LLRGAEGSLDQVRREPTERLSFPSVDESRGTNRS